MAGRNPIIIRGAREHNLRDVSLELPRNQLICLTGVSGSGKSSLAFDTLYAEGQRRYVESLSSYARQFLGQLPKPDVDQIAGLAPSIAIQQKAAGRNPRSTVGTITEIHDYLRVLFARVGLGHCPTCGLPVAAQSREQIVQRILGQPEGTPFVILAPVIRGQKGEWKDLFAELARAGYLRVRVDGQIANLSDPPALKRNVKHDIEVVIDRLTVGPTIRTRLAEAVEAALKRGDETLIVAIEGQADLVLSSRYACPKCGIGFDPPSPQLFSFNSPQGMCPSCDGLGNRFDLDPERLVPDPSLSLWDGAVVPLGPVKSMGRWRRHVFEGIAANLETDPGAPPKGTLLKKPWGEVPPAFQHAWLHGTGDRVHVVRWKSGRSNWVHPETWPGIVNELLEKYRRSAESKGPIRGQLEPYMRSVGCRECQGARLNARARAVRVGGRTLPELSALSIGRVARFFAALAGEPPADLEADEAPSPPLDPTSQVVAEELLKEIRARLGFLNDVGLHYLTLDRTAPTLSGGEAQRIRLASQVGAGLVGVVYILDEPSIGLHPRDNDRLIATLERLRDLGNTVIVVEHDEDTMRAADHLVDFGPGPGVKGGEVVAEGSLAAVARSSASLTGQYLSGRKQIPIPSQRKPPDGRWLTINNARHHNLKGIDAAIPLGLFVVVTGVSGSGKSSLIGDILRDTLARDLNRAKTEPGAHDTIEGVELLDKIIDIDQSPIGRTPRSNPATYIKLADEIRDLYVRLPEAKARGYKPGRFSFNVAGGRCEACEGNGSNRVEMDFLADVWVTCPVCEGKRFNRETQHVRFKGKSIADVFEMDVQEALEHFANVPRIAGMLQTLHDVGLDYIKLGQPSPTLSGGEAQRIKLARELVKRSTGRTLYVLDEPTTGLHFDDIHKLLAVLHRFRDEGNTVVVIEHNLDVIKTADYIIDLGPEGGAGGGRIVAQGRPEEVAACVESHTGRALARVLSGKGGRRPVKKPRAGQRASTRTTAADRMEPRAISIRGARQNNLRGIDLDIPRNELTVCSGPSGSGKSSLALETLYAEGQRRYVESLSSYARQFLAPLPKPRVDHISGLAPAVAIEQKTTSRSPRSTVGTVTEIHDYLRILYARLGKPHCPGCGRAVETQTADEIVEKILHEPEGTRLAIMAPVGRAAGEDHALLWQELLAAGFARIRVDGQTYPLESVPELSARRKPKVEVIIDRAIVRRATRSRLADSVESALDLGKGVVHVARMGRGDGELDEESRWHVTRFSQHLSCESCRRTFEPLSPHHFSFNSALGWCPSCQGLGVQTGTNPAVLIPDGRQSLREGAVAAWPPFDENPSFARLIEALGEGAGGLDLDTPFDELEPRHRRLILHGGGDQWFPVPAGPTAAEPGFSFQFKGLFPALEEASRLSFLYRMKLQGLVDEVECATCMGSRLRDDAAAVRFHGYTLDQLSRWPLARAVDFFSKLRLSADERHIAGDLVREVRERLRFLVDVGLGYLTLGRSTPTLSGGEAQRIRLASQLGSGLTGVLYVLDEPTIGLHPRDNVRLLGALRRLRDLGNTLVVVEHDREVIEAADYLVDFGPGSGRHGGEVTAAAAPARVKKTGASLTGRYLAGTEAIAVPTNRRAIDGPALVVRGARAHNLKSIDARFPLGAVTVVTGVSGSGKSSLVEDILGNAAARQLHRASTIPGAHDRIEGFHRIDKVIRVDQAPIGTTPSSNPATYTKLFDAIRELYAKLPESKMRGYTPGRFSFNMAGGRCEACQGEGQKRIEMHFLPDVWVTCDVCGGSRFTPETLAVRFRGRSIADVLATTVDEALELFAGVPRLRKILQTLHDVGLGYVALGQAAPTLSGGEAQRVKLAAELARPDTGRTLYILDEPTTGLHFADIQKLLAVLHRLADLGNTVVVIEHNLDVIKTADQVLDLGPEAGEAGGYVVVSGTPEQVAACGESLTGQILRGVLEAGPQAERAIYDPKAAARREVAEARQVARAELENNVPMPWEKDGRAWHCRSRVSRNGKPVRWDGQILEMVIDRIAAAGTFAEPDWSNRTLVRIGSPDPSAPPFLEVLTGHEWIVTLNFRVQPGTFHRETLERELNLKRFAEGDRPVLSDAPRISLSNRRGQAQQVTITGHHFDELSTAGFAAFLDRAMERALGRKPPEAGWKVIALPASKPARRRKSSNPDNKAS